MIKNILVIIIILPIVLSGQIDDKATFETRALYQNLIDVGKDNLLFGHQDDLAYGIGWTAQPGRSDVKEVCGDYPAVYGWDLGDIGHTKNLDGVSFENMKKWIKEIYSRGGISTISMHLDNPVTNGTAWDNRPAVKEVLPGGSVHEKYLGVLDKIAAFILDLKTSDGVYIPVVLRPYHEHTQTWSWWGRSACTDAEFVALWKMTVEYFKTYHNIHNLLYAISPQDVNSYEGYFFRYPGDDFVDILGLDYYNLSSPANAPQLGSTLDMLGKEAYNRGKISAITETGINQIPVSTWWTDCLYNAFNFSDDSRRTAWALVWRNANVGHHFAPYPGHSSAANFIKFYNYANTYFENDLPDMYVFNSQDDSPPIISLSTDVEFSSFDTSVNLRLTTDERAYLKYSLVDASYGDMPFSFESGQGGFVHSTNVNLEHGRSYNIYIKAADIFENSSLNSAVLNVTIDTTKLAVKWFSAEYPVSAWKTGNAPLGYNAEPLTTVTGTVKTLYFRKNVSLPIPVNGLGLLLKGNDGFVAYLNGNEIGRINMPAGGPVEYNTYAVESYNVSKIFVLDEKLINSLKEENVLAIEAHSVMSENSDISFDARLFNDDGIYIDLGAEWNYFDEGYEPLDLIVDKVTSMDEPNDVELPGFILYQNYPNPFNPECEIKFQIENPGRMKLVVYDVLGREVSVLLDAIKSPGIYNAEFNGTNLPSGVYIYRLTHGSYTQSKKMVLIR